MTSPNNFDFWFKELEISENIKQSIFKIPASQWLLISDEWSGKLSTFTLNPAVINEFTTYLLSNLALDPTKKYFIKNATFSNKFNFKDCLVTDIQNIGEQFINICYASLSVQNTPNNLIVVREYIESKTPETTIYNGMPLRSEIRYFVDFDHNQILGAAQYWHKDLMQQNLLYMLGPNIADMPIEIIIKARDAFKAHGDQTKHKADTISDYLTFYEFHQTDNFDTLSAELKEPLIHALSDVNLNGKWSVDIMLENGTPYIIDMALMKDSALTQYIKPI